MKKLFLSMAAAILSATSFAQTTLVATLSHEGNISTFFGANALKSAHGAAADGDCITLSSGQFNAVDITKAVTIRGAGMEVDSILGTKPTIISGDFSINITDNGTDRLMMEGIYHNHTITYKGTLESPMFVKCRLASITYVSSGTAGSLKNASFVHCKIASQLYLTSNCSAFCTNCVIKNPYSSNGTSSNFEITNCVVLSTVVAANNGGMISQIKSSSLSSHPLKRVRLFDYQ